MSFTINDSVTLTSSASIDNLRLSSNTISSTNTNGNINLYPNGTGNVGIGTNSPYNKLDIRGNLSIGNSDSNFIAFHGTPDTDGPAEWCSTFIGERVYSGLDNSELLLWKGNDTGLYNTFDDDTGPDRIRYTSVGGHLFQTISDQSEGAININDFEAAANVSATDRMIITNVGNVGIGKNNPETALHVYKEEDTTSVIYPLRIEARTDNSNVSNKNSGVGMEFVANRGTGAQHVGAQIYSQLYSGAGTVSDHWSLNFNIRIDDTIQNAMVITPIGENSDPRAYVGIGTTSPTSPLQITGAGGVLTMEGTGSGSHCYIQYYNDGRTNTRNGWIGYGNDGSTDLTINNDVVDGDIILRTPNNVGIGTTIPQGKLHVEGGGSGPGTGSAWRAYFNHGYSGIGRSVQNPGWGIDDVGIYSNKTIITSGYIVAMSNNFSSDRRIKKDIVDIVDSSALDTIRLIKPKKYSYKDTINRGDTPVWGFIAQEVSSVLDYAVNLTQKPIPNIYSPCIVSEDGMVLELTNAFDTAELVYDKDGNLVSKIQFITWDDKEVYAEIEEVISSSKIKIKNFLNPEYHNGVFNDDIIKNEIFLYGQCVPDFHVLNKDAIFTVAVAALQEVDRRQVADNERITELEAENEALQSEVNLLKQQMATVMQKLGL